MQTAPQNNYQPDNPSDEMPLTGHLSELRSRILKSLAALALGGCISFAYIDHIMNFLTAAAGNLYYMRPAEAFVIYMKIALLSGLLIASPVILWQLYRFVSPALLPRERHFALLCLPVILLLGIGGMAFSYLFIFPRGLEFFLGFAAGKISPLISMESYLSFMLMLVVPFGLIFNIPVVLTLLGCMGIVSAAGLQRYQKHVILAAFILAAFITPTPDIITQALLAVPMVVLYYLSIILVKFINAK